VAGRRALQAYQPPRRVASTEAPREDAGAPETVEEGAPRRSRPRKERVNNLF
jgi:hypothetical protein